MSPLEAGYSIAMDERVRQLLDNYGTTYAEEAGIRLSDRPSPLYQLLVLAVLLAHPIQADIAVDAAHELFRKRWRTPKKMLEATWQQRVDALGKAHYVRYDESTATALGEGAELLLQRHDGDLRKIHSADRSEIRKALQEFPRIGPTGADIFCREAQAVWPELRPYFDDRALDGARKSKLPADPERLAQLVPDEEYAKLAAALVRITLEG